MKVHLRMAARPIAVVCLFVGMALPLLAEDEVTTPFDGVRYVHRHVSEPREIDMHIVIVDLGRPGTRIVTTGPNDDPHTETDLETTRQFAMRTGTKIAINGGFFARTADALRLGRTDLVSLAVSAGVVVSPWGRGQSNAINIGDDNTVTFVRRDPNDSTGWMTSPPVKPFNAIAGNVRLIECGTILAPTGGNPTYPQTAVGHSADKELIVFVSDGRQPGFSEGMTYEEVAHVLKEFNAVDAIAFDGGGLATIVLEEAATGKPRVLNRPADGAERQVGNNLGIVVGM